MIEYELEYLNWKERQLTMRQKYADTPPGLDAEHAARERARLCEDRALYEARRRWRLTSDAHFPPEPFVGRRREAAVAYRDSVLGHTLIMKLTLCNPHQLRIDQQTAKSILANFRLRKTEQMVLCELTFVSLSGIPEEIFLSCTGGNRESLENLKRYSLVQTRVGTDGRVFLSLHPVIDEAKRLMRKTYEAVRDYYGTAHQACAHMALRMAAIYHNQMRFSESRQWYELACQICRKAKPLRAELYLDEAEACEKMARLMEYDGDYTEGHRYVDEAIAAMEEFRRCTEKEQPQLWNLRRNLSGGKTPL